MNKRAQGAFEYVLLLAGIILIAVIALLILRGSILPSANSQISTNLQNYSNSANLICTLTFSNGTVVTPVSVQFYQGLNTTWAAWTTCK